MTRVSSVKRVTLAAVCIALCYVLPIAFHAVGLGGTFSPMHIPVIFCGLVCGGGYGLFCGVAGPVLSCVLSGMPTVTALIFMVPELMIYGLISGMVMKLVRTGNLYVDIYIALIAAMLLGRVAGGIASAVFYIGSGKSFGIAAWAASYFAGSIPGMILQLILLPVMIVTLMKASLIPNRY